MLKEAQKQNNSALDDALSSLADIIGQGNVLTTVQNITSYENTTFKTDNKIIAVILPKNIEEVQACVRTANEYKLPLYPVSKGKNWGYGSNIPSKDGSILLSLEKLNSITDFNEEMAYITVEPGVTFGQVHDFLNTKKSTLIAPAIGSTAEASLIGNALERGIGKGIYGDRFQHSCNIEIVLANGEIINTGFGNIKDSNTRNVYKWGIGPSIDGIFSQSNFGIVTKMTFWLNKKPASFQAIFYTVKNNQQLARTVDALRQLRLEGTLTTTATLSNSYRILSMKKQFPENENSDLQMPEHYMHDFKKTSLMDAGWIGDDAILAPTEQIAKARAKRVKELLWKEADKLIIINKRKAGILRYLWKPLKKLTGIDMRELLFFYYNSFYLGIPMEKQLSICYWRKKIPVPAKPDPDKDRCGVIWCSPSVPFKGEHVIKVLGLLEDLYEKYQFEPNIGLNFMSDRGIAFTAAIIYDRETEGHDKKAMDCYNEIMKTLLEAGYPSYRLGIQSMDDMISTSPEYVNLINKLKSAIDPNNIISPGHYGIHGINN